MVFQGIDHEIQRLYVHWDITTMCNYQCNYCYAEKHYSDRDSWQKEASNKDIDLIIKSLSLSTLPVFLGLLGGEPTTSRNYEYIIHQVQQKILPLNDRNRLYITTNLSKNLEYWKQHPKINNTFILASFHPEHNTTKESIEIFIEKLLYLRKYFKVKVNIMLDPNYDNINFMWEELILKHKLNKYVIIHPHIIYPNGSPFNNLDKIYKTSLDKYERLFQYAPHEFEFDGVPMKDIDVFSQKRNSFTSWDCYQNNYEISFDGFVTNICFTKRVKLSQNPLFFRNIKRIRPRTCQKDFCNCDGLLKCRKENVNLINDTGTNS